MALVDQTNIREQWYESCYMKSNSLNSRQMAENALKIFDEFLMQDNKQESSLIQELKNMENKPEFYLFLNSYVQFLNKRELSRSSIDIHFSCLKSYLRYQGIRIYREDVSQFVNMPRRITELKTPLTADIIRTLIDNASEEMRALLLFLASSGLRISEALQLRIQDINLENDPVVLRIRAESTKTRQERNGFVSKETMKYLTPLVQNKKPYEFVFCEIYSHNSLITKESAFNKLRRKCNLLQKYDNERRYRINIHSFRAFFHTQATKILGGDIAHALIGHKNYLDQYFRLTPEEQGELYKKLEPYITIYGDQKVHAKNKILEEQAKRFKEFEDKVAKLEAALYNKKLINS